MAPSPAAPEMPSTLVPVMMLRSHTNHSPIPQEILQGLQGPGGPSEQGLADLQDFVYKLFFLDFSSSFFIQMLVAAILILALIIVGSILIGDRLLKQKFWLFKLTHRPEGIYIVPNALNTFLIFEGAFGIVWFAFAVISIQLYRGKADHVQHQIQVWNIVTWIPLWLGAFFAGWGSFYTAPNTLNRPLSSSHKMALRRLVPRPFVINLICLGTPIMLIASLLTPIILAQRQLSHTYDDYKVWDARVAGFIGANAASLDPTVANSLIDEASALWDGVADATWYGSISFILWSFWAGSFLAFYIPAGGYVVWLVWIQVRKSKALLSELDRRALEASAVKMVPVSPQPDSKGRNSWGKPIHRHSRVSSGGPLIFAPLAGAPHAPTGGVDNPVHATSSTAVPDNGITPPSSPTFPHRPFSPVAARAKEFREDVQEFFFPPLRPDVRKRMTRVVPAGTPSSRYRYLRRCFTNLICLYVGVAWAATIYLVVTSRLGAQMYDAMLKGPQAQTRIIYTSDIPAAWAAVVFGSLTIGSIWSRHFDPESGRSETGSKPKSPFSRNSKVPPTPSPHTKTRALPPVPESVSVSAGVTTTQRSHSFSDLRSAIKFSIMRDASKPETLVMKPCDPGSSQVSLNETSSAPAHDVEETESRPFVNTRNGNGGRGGRMNRFGAKMPQDAKRLSLLEEVEMNPRQVFYPTPYGPVAAPAPSEPQLFRSAPTTPQVGSSSRYESASSGAPSSDHDQFDPPARSPTLVEFPRHSVSMPRSPTSPWIAREWANAEREDPSFSAIPRSTSDGSIRVGLPPSPTFPPSPAIGSSMNVGRSTTGNTTTRVSPKRPNIPLVPLEPPPATRRKARTAATAGSEAPLPRISPGVFF